MTVLDESLLLGAPAAATGYQISRSLRFNLADSAYLSRTPASAGNRKTWTWAGWVKRSALSAGNLFACTSGSTDSTYLRLHFSGDKLYLGTYATNLRGTTAVYRDASAWYHIVLAVDTTQATGSNRFKIYVNGVQVTAFDIANDLTQNADLGVNQNTAHYIGSETTTTGFFNGYLADVHFIDGQALTPSSFGEFDANGEWQPKAYTGTYGTNGFKLNFADNSAATAAALGKDTSGNGNNWTPNNLQALAGGPYSIAVATGAVPIQNTTDTYGSTIGTGVRSDANASSLVLAAPLTTAGGNTLSDDKQPSGRTSSTKTLTATGTVASDTSVFKYYGGSASFSASSYYSLNSTDFTFGTGDFTIEAWVYNPTGTSGSMFSTALNSLANTTVNSRFNSTGTVEVYTSGGGDYISIASVPLNQWVHVAMVRSGTAMNVFINGELKGTGSWSMSLADSGNFYINTGRDGSGARRYQDVRVYKGLAKYSGGFNVPTSTQNTTVAAQCDSLVDTPTSYGTDTGFGGEVRGNYCTWNPVGVSNYGATAWPIVNGALDANDNTNGIYGVVPGTMAVSSGKWYWEVTVTTGLTAIDFYAGLGIELASITENRYKGSYGSCYYYNGDGTKNVGTTSSSYGTAWTSGNVIGVALDLTANTITFYRNNATQGAISIAAGEYRPVVGDFNNAAGTNFSANFGQRPFAYTAPAGFKALCDTNLPAPAIVKPSTVMDVKLYTGNGSTQTISGLGFGPDLVWLKARNQAATSNRLFDIVRGAGNVLYSDATSAESAEGSLTSFDAAGFTLPNSGTTNLNTTTYVAWCWDAGSSNVVNTQGSITSTVRANPSAGFSVCTVTATSTNDVTFGHGLGVAPQLIIGKNRTATNNWIVYHKSLTADNALYLNTTGASVLDYAYSQGVGATPSSTIVPIRRGNWGVSGDNLVFYCFAPVAGYSSFGSYTGNGNASNDGPFVYTGFRPRWVMIKSTSSGNWTIFDALRVGYNVDNEVVYPNLASGSGVDNDRRIDILSNGFKIRNTAFGSTDINGTTATTYIYAAFAENPFSISRAR